MPTVYNFSAGPAILPKRVLEQAQAEFMNYQDSQMSILELSHRSSLFESIIQEAEALLRELMNIPDNYSVLFLQGGASLQFTMVPLNLALNQTAAYVETGTWSEKAIEEAKKIPSVSVEIVASSKKEQYHNLPEVNVANLPQDAAYLHITTNNTIEGTAFYDIPQTGAIPLVADMSSNILAFDYNVADFGLIYAGAQKNLGPAGVTIVIVRDDLFGQVTGLSTMLDYATHAKNASLYNTPPTFSIYLTKLVLEWVKAQGGVPKMHALAQEKAQLLYDALERSTLFSSPVAKKDRSLTNIPFVTGNPTLDEAFLTAAEKQGFKNLKGHRAVGGMRASLYNAFPLDGVTALVAFMEQFELEQGGN